MVKVGDLVKVKFVSEAQVSRNMMSNEPVNKVGVVIEVAENSCKVFFPERDQFRTFLQSSLEIIKE
jgi:hypothetical protein